MNRTTRRQIIFYIGGPKTGASSVLLCLLTNASALETASVDYRNATVGLTPERAQSGNGHKLYTFLTQTDCSDSALLDLIVGAYFARGLTAICASESFAGLSETAWTAVKESCKRLNLNSTIIMCVRNVYPYAYSLYHQIVKQHGENCSFSEFIYRPFLWHATALRYVTRIFGKRRIRVLHYETIEDRLVAEFFHAAGIDHIGLAIEPPSHRLNRRLSLRELNIMVLANRLLGPKYSRLLAKMMMFSHSGGAPIPPLEDTVAEHLERRFSADVAWLNDEYFGSQPTVTIGGAYLCQEHATDPTSDESSPEIRALAWAFREISELSENANADLITRLENMLREIRGLCMDKTLSKSPLIPPDFDPVMYLICNPDLIVAGTNPYEHFLSWGIKEGRKWML